MRPVLAHFGSITLYSYGLMIAIGVILAFVIMERRAPSYGLNKDKGFGMALCVAIFGFLGAKGLFLLLAIPKLIQDPSLFPQYLSSGFIVFGGIILGILSGIVYTKIKKMVFLQYFDLFMPSVALAQGFGRLGCFMAGCCYGTETHSAFHVVFPGGAYCEAPAGVPLVPTQLISAILNFLNFLVLCIFARKRYQKGSTAYGEVGALYLILYSIGRFIIEFFRGDPRGNIGPLSTSQFIAFFTLAAGIILMICARKGKTYTEAAETAETEAPAEQTEEAAEEGAAEVSDTADAESEDTEAADSEAAEPESADNESTDIETTDTGTADTETSDTEPADPAEDNRPEGANE